MSRATWIGMLTVLAACVLAAPGATRNAPVALAQISCLQNDVPCQGYNNPDPVSGSALLPDLNGYWMDNGHTVLVTMVANSDCLVSGATVPCGGGSVVATYVQPIVCDHQDGTGDTDQTTIDFTGQLEDGTGGQPLDIVGTTSGCQYGTDNPNGVGFHQTAIYLVVSADAQTLTGIWNNAGDNSPVQLTRLMSTPPASGAPTPAASATPAATPTSTASATPLPTPTSTASATPAATPPVSSPGGPATTTGSATPAGNTGLAHVGLNPSACAGPFTGAEGGTVTVTTSAALGTATLDISLDGAQPDTTYVVDLRCMAQIGTVSTDAQGAATAQISVPMSQMPAGTFYVDLSVPGGGGSGGYGDTFIAGPFTVK